MGGPAVHGVVGGLFVLAGLAGFLVAPDDEYPVVRTGRDCQRSQQAHRKGGKSDSPAMPQNRYDSARSRQFDPHRDQQENHGDYRPVDEQQHNKDHGDRNHGDPGHGSIATVVHIRGECGWSGHIGLYARRRGRAFDDAAYCLDGFVGQRRALVAGK